MAQTARDPAALIEQYIEPNPDRPGVGDARLREYGVPVWALVGYGEATGRDAVATARAYRLPLEAVEAALAYRDRYPAEIAARIADNAA
ncbi:MAG TPA: hypothetical protein VFE37_08685 [Chloroflexota bacterium]|nr:hypothetical protein [Chloroflexota bacterium]